MQGQRISVSDIAYHELKKQIIELNYQPGLTIQEQKLSKTLEISRTPLRQALYRLELEGLIIKQANGRMKIKEVSIEEAEDIFSVRAVLEGLIVQQASNHIIQEDITNLKKVLTKMEQSIEHKDVLANGNEFHNILYKYGSETAITILLQIKDRIERYRKLSGYKNPEYNVELPMQEHKEILQALEKHDSEKAEELMKKHIYRSLKTVKETINIYP